MNERVYLKRVKLFFGHASGNMMSAMFGGILISIVLFSTKTSIILISYWMLAIIIVSALTAVAEISFRKVKLDMSNARTWLIRRIVSGSLVGVMYGISPFLLTTEAGTVPELFLFIILLIMVAVGSIGYSVMPVYYLILDLLFLGPITITFFERLDTFHMVMIATSLIAQTVILQKALAVSRSMIEALYTNEQLQMEINERTKMEEELKKLASIDSLTGKSNRRHGLLFLEQQIKMAKRIAFSLTVCFVDLDGLKAINDTYGHEVGDEAIKAASDILSKALRDSDLICRLGGDEFLLIFPDCKLEQASSIWGRVSDEVQNFNALPGKPYRLSISHGFSEFAPTSDLDADNLIALADNEMYQMKNARREHGDQNL